MTTIGAVEELVGRVLEGSVTEEFALEVLAHNGLTPDAEHLDEAVTQLRAREGIKDGSVDALSYLDCEPKIGLDSFEAAITEADKRYVWAISCLAQAIGRCDCCEGPGPLIVVADGDAEVCQTCIAELARPLEVLAGQQEAGA